MITDYDYEYDDGYDAGTLGDVGPWGAVGQIGGQVGAAGLALLVGQHQQGAAGQAQCHNTTVSCLDTLIGQYQAAVAQIGNNPAALIQLIQQTLGVINDPHVFDQQNDPYLVNTRNQLQARLTSLNAGGTVGTTGTPGGTVTVRDPQTGQPVTVTLPAAAPDAGISGTTLLLVGGGLLLLLFMNKN